jgi:hypothetical protein
MKKMEKILLFLLCMTWVVRSIGDVFQKAHFRERYTGLSTNIEGNDVTHRPVETILGQELQYHGTTTLAFKFNQSVIVCVDSKASRGNYVASRTVKKVIPISKTILATMAGGAADCTFQIRKISSEVKLQKSLYDWKLPVSGIARMLAKKLRKIKGSVILTSRIQSPCNFSTRNITRNHDRRI